ncbi:MAG: hypothetical protein GC191_03205 [Azospirillum sp.]|nr:hypothetical protein [Azospirillum sp.]
MENLLNMESFWGFALFGASLLIGPPLYRAYRREPIPALLRNDLVAELLLLAYFIVIVTSAIAAIAGLL